MEWSYLLKLTYNIKMEISYSSNNSNNKDKIKLEVAGIFNSLIKSLKSVI
jgi:hypothetical protein